MSQFVDKDGLLSFWKDPDSVLDFTIDWKRWLGADTISTSTWTVTDITKDSESNTTTTTTIWVSAGNSPYGEATNTIVTVGGRTKEKTIRFYRRDQ